MPTKVAFMAWFYETDDKPIGSKTSQVSVNTEQLSDNQEVQLNFGI